MRNWKFLLTSQLIRGTWLIHPMEALSAGGDLKNLLDLVGSESVSDIIDVRGSLPYQFVAGSSYDEGSSYDSLPNGSIAIFRVSGTMLKYGTLCSYGTEEIGDMITNAANHPKISGGILVMDTGGGAVNSVAPLVDSIAAFKSKNKPILSLADAAYSAGYWTVSETDHIMASNNISSGFGSIGVMTSFIDVRPKYEKEGYKFHTIYAPESTEKNAAFELALQGEYEKIKNEELSPLAINFQNAVKRNRAGKLQLDDNQLELKGKTYLAEKAMDRGLIDSIGSMSDAIDWVKEEIEVRKFMSS